jgi:glucokinase
MFRGASGYAGEFGHTIVEPNGRPCACGSHGCLETRVSATGIMQTARESNIGHEISSAEDLYEAAMRGNSVARAIFEDTGRYLGVACSNLINLLNPEAIVVGGGVMASGEIVQSQLWPDSGTIGAAMLARDTA